MSTQERAGIRAARALLSLLEENSSEELEAAESILAGEKVLVEVLQKLRLFKEHEEPPLSPERLREIVRGELIALGLTVPDWTRLGGEVFGIPLRTPPSVDAEGAVNQILRFIDTEIDSPSEQVDALLMLLTIGARRAGPEPLARITSIIRDLAVQALTENTVMFSTLHSLANLRTKWGASPLPYKHQEPRRRLARRLLTDAERLNPQTFPEIAADLLRAGLRGPADGAIAEMRGMRAKKAHGE